MYWLVRTKATRVDPNGNIEGGGSMDEFIQELMAGRLPPAFRRFSKSAAKI